MLKNYRVGIREIPEDINISYGSTLHIFVYVLDMNRVIARLVPKDLSLLQKRRRAQIAKEIPET